MILAFLLGGLAALACDEIQSVNGDLHGKMDLENQVQKALEEQMVADSQKCQADASRLSGQAAATAGAQSCVALRESASMNRQLNDVSVTCAEKMLKMKQAMEGMQETYFDPFRTSVDLVVQNDQGDAYIRRICPSEISDTANVLSRADKFRNRVQHAIEIAQGNFQTFSTLALQTAQFATVTQSGYDRCSAEQAPLTAGTSGQGSREPAAVPVPSGASPRESSSITGIVEDAVKRAQQGDNGK